MRIALKPVPPVAGAVAVGTLDGDVLSYVGREPHVGGRRIEHADIANALADAVDEVGAALFGGDYVNNLARVLDLNRRTVTRDRVLKNGLPPWALAVVGQCAASECPRATGYMLLAAAEYLDRGPLAQGSVIMRTHRSDRDELRCRVQPQLEQALKVVAEARDARFRPKPKIVEDE